MSLNKVGGIIILISLFLPVLAIIIGPIFIVQWMFGFVTRTIGRRTYGPGFPTYLGIFPLIGIPFFILILVFGILCIKQEPGKTKIYGIFSIVCVIVYFIVSYYWFQVNIETYDVVTITLIPHIGFFGIIIGSILNIIAK